MLLSVHNRVVSIPPRLRSGIRSDRWNNTLKMGHMHHRPEVTTTPACDKMSRKHSILFPSVFITWVIHSMVVKPTNYLACYREPLHTSVSAVLTRLCPSPRDDERMFLVLCSVFFSVSVGVGLLSTAFVPEKCEVNITSTKTPQLAETPHTKYNDSPRPSLSCWLLFS